MPVYHKLVRDKILAIIEANGQSHTSHVADLAEFKEKLREKLQEEVQEFVAEPSVEELADIMEVIHGICDAYDIDWNALEVKRQEKKEKRGGFSKRIILEEVEEK